MIAKATAPPPLTPQQRAALEARGVSVALSAGAGCGKTLVLTRRFLSLLEGSDRLPIDRIVALTFTEKAARELRDRVRRGCRDRLESADDPASWKETLRGLEFARIGTFHSFCAAVLKEFAAEAGVDPGFSVLDDAIASSVRDEALTSCLRLWLSEGNPDLVALAVDYGLDAVREALADLLADRPSWDVASWCGLSPEEVVASWEGHRDRAFASSCLGRLAEEHRGLLDLLGRNECSHKVGALRRAALLADLPGLASAKSPCDALGLLLEQARVQGGGTKAHWPSEEVYEEVKLRLNALRDGLKALIVLFEPDGGRSLPAAENGLRFARLARAAMAAYDETKHALGLLDFHDLQALVLDLMRRDDSPARRRMSETISALLVDEFQDTDPVQAEILDLLAGPESGAGRYFLVGDIKQSIYNFRGRAPALFGSYRERFPEAGRLNLTENFRSVPEVLAFVNGLFGEVFPGPEHRLVPGTGAVAQGASEASRVEFLWTEGPPDTTSRRKAEATAIARVLATRLAEGWPIRDRKGGTPRLATPGDVALLFRARSDFPLYEHALAAEGLDYHLVGGTTYFAQQEVIDLINLLSTLEDPLDALALAGTLRGPIFGVSDAALFWLATASPGALPETFARWETVADRFSDDDRRAVARAYALLSRWRGRKDRVSIAALLDLCLEESGFEAALLGEFLGDRKRANVRKLVRLARRFQARGGFTLADFVARLRADLKTPPREEQAATTDEQGKAVRLMTIHQSKGLEFPIVVLPDLERKAPNVSDLIACDETLGVLVRASSDDDEDDERPRWNLGRALRDRERRAEEDAEALRTLYVAATRAEDALILSAGRSPDDPPRSPAMRLLASRFDLQTGEFLGETPPDSPAPIVGVIDPRPLQVGLRAGRPTYRPKLLLTARRIRQGAESAEEAPCPETPPPSFVDLRGADLAEGRLLLAVVTDPRWRRGEPLPGLVASVAKARGIWATARTLDECARLLSEARPREVWGAIDRSDLVRFDLEWTLSWPIGSPEGTVYRGRIDLAVQTASGAWDLLHVARAETPRDRARARLRGLLSIRAAEALGLGSVSSSRWIRLDPRGAVVERLPSDNLQAIDRAIREGITVG